MNEYSVYIVSNKALKPLYIGVTNDLYRRIFEHKNRDNPKSFTAKYDLKKLLYYEDYDSVLDAIGREKQLKNWHREWKLNLIKEENPTFEDLAKDWYD